MNACVNVPVIIASILAGAYCLSAQTPIDLKVCDLFDDMVRWDGQMVRFEAKIERGGGEGGLWIDGLDCKAQIQILGVKFPNALIMGNPQGGKESQRIHAVDFSTEPNDEYNRLIAQVNQKTEYLHAVVVGLFETRTPLTRLVKVNAAWPNGTPAGFGHLGTAPAHILLKSLADLRVEKKPSRKLDPTQKSGIE